MIMKVSLQLIVLALATIDGDASPQAWSLFDSTNAVSGKHDSNVTYFSSIASAQVCESLADAHNTSIFTWCDHTCDDPYALTCALRMDGSWQTVSQKGHTSGFKGVPQPTPKPTPVPSVPACSLNGVLNSSGVCQCDNGWTGALCGQLALVPAEPLSSQVSAGAALTTDNGIANATWGMSVVGPLSGVYHGYMTEIANSCGLADYASASQVIHMTASSPLGPWVRRGVALAGFAHNPQAILTANGTVILFHIGTEEQPGCLLDCRGTAPSGTNPHPPKPRPANCNSSLSHSASLAVAASPFGPFTRYPYIFGESAGTNPAPHLEPNGTLIVALRRGTSMFQHIYIGNVNSIVGPWKRVEGTVVSTAAGSLHTYEEDPFLFKNTRGWHMLTRRSVADAGAGAGGEIGSCPDACRVQSGCVSPCVVGPGTCGGGHLYSTDLKVWFFGENVYGATGAADEQCNLLVRPNTQINLTSRERPTIFDDTATGKRYLFTGASVNMTMYYHSFTLVQEMQI